MFLPLVRNPTLGNACAGSVSGHDSDLVCNPGEVSSVCIDGCVVGSMSQARVCKLSPEKKYSLLTNHFKPKPTYKFPSRPLDGCNRAYANIDNSHFVYSDGIYCLPCVLFADS